jgi:hypothetical protein
VKAAYTSTCAKGCCICITEPARLSGTLHYRVTQNCSGVSSIYFSRVGQVDRGATQDILISRNLLVLVLIHGLQGVARKWATDCLCEYVVAM